MFSNKKYTYSAIGFGLICFVAFQYFNVSRAGDLLTFWGQWGWITEVWLAGVNSQKRLAVLIFLHSWLSPETTNLPKAQPPHEPRLHFSWRSEGLISFSATALDDHLSGH